MLFGETRFAEKTQKLKASLKIRGKAGKSGKIVFGTLLFVKSALPKTCQKTTILISSQSSKFVLANPTSRLVLNLKLDRKSNGQVK